MDSFVMWISAILLIGNSRNSDVDAQCMMSLKNCSSMSTCSKRSAADSRVQVPHYTFAKYNCRCDEMCHIFNDCCHDVASSDDVMRESYETATPRLEVIECERPANVFTFGYHVYYVKRCPETFDDDVIRAYCELATSNDVMSAWPVTDDYGLLYKNEYCAYCNNVSDYLRWNVRFGCQAEAENRLSSINHTSLAQFIYANDAGCSFTFEHTAAVENDEAGARVCKPHVDTCVTSWRDDCVRHHCEAENASLSLVHINSAKLSYRNQFCALCNDVSDYDCSDRFTIKSIVIPILVNTFSQLFHPGKKCCNFQWYFFVHCLRHCGHNSRVVLMYTWLLH